LRVPINSSLLGMALMLTIQNQSETRGDVAGRRMATSYSWVFNIVFSPRLSNVLILKPSRCVIGRFWYKTGK
jgi:hypothetical protein